MIDDPTEPPIRPTVTMVLVIKRETVWQAWSRDASTFVLFMALIGVGVWMESAVMQWVGAAIAFILLLRFSHVAGARMTPTEARIEIDRIEAQLEREV